MTKSSKRVGEDDTSKRVLGEQGNSKSTTRRRKCMITAVPASSSGACSAAINVRVGHEQVHVRILKRGSFIGLQLIGNAADMGS